VPSLAGATQDEVRRSNLSTVLRLLHLGGPQTRSQLTVHTGLNRSTVGDLVSALASLGLVRERPGDVRGVGRPSLVVEPVPMSVAVLALDLRVERTVAALVGLGGEVFARAERRHLEGEREVLIDEVAQVARSSGTDRYDALKKIVNKQTERAVWGLTGTPTPNRPTDAWAQCNLVVPGSVPPYFNRFRDDVMVKLTQFKFIPKKEATEKVFSVMQPSVRFTLDDGNSILCRTMQDSGGGYYLYIDSGRQTIAVVMYASNAFKVKIEA
jgi:predicted transcriptional regulator